MGWSSLVCGRGEEEDRWGGYRTEALAGRRFGPGAVGGGDGDLYLACWPGRLFGGVTTVRVGGAWLGTALFRLESFFWWEFVRRAMDETVSPENPASGKVEAGAALPPGPRPKYFISAVTAEFGALRTRVGQVLQFLGCEGDFMETWGTEPGSLRMLHERKIDACDGLIQIVGAGYGAEPGRDVAAAAAASAAAAAEARAEGGGGAAGPARFSYTQAEFHYARAKGKKTWLLIAGPDAPRDRAIDQLDLPRDGAICPDPAAYQKERRDLQAAYRESLRAGGQEWTEVQAHGKAGEPKMFETDSHIRHSFNSWDQLEIAVLRMRGETEARHAEFREWLKGLKDGVERIETGQGEMHEEMRAGLADGLRLWLVIVSLLLVLGMMVWGTYRLVGQKGEETAAAVASMDTIGHWEVQSRERARNDYAAEKERLAGLKDADARQAGLDRLEAEHAYRMERIERVFADLREGYKNREISDVTAEFQRILADESGAGGIDAALDYLAPREDTILAEAKRHLARREEEERQAREQLRTLLSAADSASAEGRPAKAAELYRALLDTDPAWVEALTSAGWFYYERTIFEETHGSFALAIGYSEEALNCANRLRAVGGLEPRAQRLIGSAVLKRADVLIQRGQPGDFDEALEGYTEAMAIYQNLYDADPQSLTEERNVSVALNRLGDVYRERGQAGDLDAALEFYERDLEIAEKLYGANPESRESARDVSVSLNRLGDVYVERGRAGDLEAALEFYERDLEIAEKLYGANPESRESARDVSLSLERLGDVYWERRQTGDLDAALEKYGKGLEIREKLYEANPESREAARDVSISLERLGDVYRARGQTGDVEAALEKYEKGLEIREKLYGANPESRESARDVSLSLNRLGDVYRARGEAGDVEAALEKYEKGLEIAEKLYGTNPESRESARDVSVSLERLGDVYRARGEAGDLEAALEKYGKGLEIREKLYGANPESRESARDVSVSLNKLGDVFRARGEAGDVEAALEKYEKGLEIAEKLYGANPESRESARDVSFSLNRLGDVYRARGEAGDLEAALENYERDLEIAENLYEANPLSVEAVRDLAVSHHKLSLLVQETGDSDRARRHRRSCYEVLRKAIEAGYVFDAIAMGVYEELRAEFGADSE